MTTLLMPANYALVKSEEDMRVFSFSFVLLHSTLNMLKCVAVVVVIVN